MPIKGCKHLTKSQRERIPGLHRTGRSTETIAGELGCSVDQVRYALRMAGLKPSGGKGGKCYGHADQILGWAAEGLSLSEMARRIGTTHNKVRSFLDRHGVEFVRFRQTGPNNPAWKGGRMTDKNGYILIRMPDHPMADSHGYIREHRLVMERELGRFLTPDEVVHHKDETKDNNLPGNLHLYGTNAEHLAETLKGRIPDWSEEGFRKIQERWSRLGGEQRASNRPA